MPKYLIVGGVAGGATVAARLRRIDESAEIIMFERGKYISYANCGLPYYVGEVIKDRENLFVQTPESFGKRFNMQVRVESNVESINRDEKSVTVKNLTTGESYNESYDKLILSPGAAMQYLKMGEEFMKSPIPDELKGTEDEEYFVEELEAKKFEMRDRALSLLLKILRVSYKKSIDNMWTDKLKDRIREIDGMRRPPHPIIYEPHGHGSNIYQEYIDAIERIKLLTAVKNDYLVNQMEPQDVIAQLKSMQLEAKRRQEEEKITLGKLTKEFAEVKEEVRCLDKEIFILGGGKLENWKDKTEQEIKAEEKALKEKKRAEKIAQREVDKKAAEDALRKKQEKQK